MWGASCQEDSYEGEVFLWQLEGESEVTRSDGSTTGLEEDSCLIIPPKEKYVCVFSTVCPLAIFVHVHCFDIDHCRFSAICKSDGRRLSVKTNPLANKPKEQ